MAKLLLQTILLWISCVRHFELKNFRLVLLLVFLRCFGFVRDFEQVELGYKWMYTCSCGNSSDAIIRSGNCSYTSKSRNFCFWRKNNLLRLKMSLDFVQVACLPPRCQIFGSKVCEEEVFICGNLNILLLLNLSLRLRLDRQNLFWRLLEMLVKGAEEQLIVVLRAFKLLWL